MMTTISAFIVKMTPNEALKVRNMLISTPAAATIAPPSAKANADAAATLIATSRAAEGSTATARIAVPIRVRVSARYSASPSATREAERDQPIERERLAEHRDRHGEERVLK